MRKGAGFTLIELLIVVAIIGVLAAIAVPNFLNAQMRAKVARAQSDMKTIGTALEMYNMDNGAYPTWRWARVAGSGDFFHPNVIRFYRLTTPVSYLSSIPNDPFVQELNKDDFEQWGIAYDYVNGWNDDGTWRPSGWGHVWRLNSWGPDGINDWGGQRYHDCPDGVPDFQYQASNGLTSRGDIVWVGSKDTRNSTIKYCEIQNGI